MSNVFYMPEMKSGRELERALTIYPEYDNSISDMSQTERLLRLSDIYNIYIPSQMTHDIYSKLYLALLRSIQKKENMTAKRQIYNNKKAILQQDYQGILGGADSFTIIGISGIGKSSAIHRAISLITNNNIIEIHNPYAKIIPCVIVQCPFDASVKGLLLEVLRQVDCELGSDYYNKSMRARATTDMLIGSVSQVCLKHIGMLVVDEIQNVVMAKHGRNLMGALTQLINNSGVSICMVGTPESKKIFESAMQLARRSVGLEYCSLAYDSYFDRFCEKIYGYQYVKIKTSISPMIKEWLYEHSSGVISVVVSLIHDAQEIAILTGKEVLNIETLNEAYEQRLKLLHEYIRPTITQQLQTTRAKKYIQDSLEYGKIEVKSKSYAELVRYAKENETDIVRVIKENYAVVEVAI